MLILALVSQLIDKGQRIWFRFTDHERPDLGLVRIEQVEHTAHALFSAAFEKSIVPEIRIARLDRFGDSPAGIQDWLSTGLELNRYGKVQEAAVPCRVLSSSSGPTGRELVLQAVSSWKPLQASMAKKSARMTTCGPQYWTRRLHELVDDSYTSIALINVADSVKH